VGSDRVAVNSATIAFQFNPNPGSRDVRRVSQQGDWSAHSGNGEVGAAISVEVGAGHASANSGSSELGTSLSGLIPKLATATTTKKLERLSVRHVQQFAGRSVHMPVGDGQIECSVQVSVQECGAEP
jgi:hypothetical protein